MLEMPRRVLCGRALAALQSWRERRLWEAAWHEGTPCPRPLPPNQVANIDAPPAASAALCRAICYPRLALKCAALREAIAFMGHSGAEGEEVRLRRGGGWCGVERGCACTCCCCLFC